MSDDNRDPISRGELETATPRIGRYIIISELGRGGMGAVFKALDERSGRHVALKVIAEQLLQDPDALRRFEREARAAAVIDHQNVARIHGFETTADHRPFIVMEYVDGVSLDKVIRNNPDIPFSRLVDFALQAARGLEAAHRHAIIHRDIKPANLLLTVTDEIKIIDFGLAKSMWDQSMITGTGMVVGTPRYISPEQGKGRPVDHRSDIYSLGATFYELVTRQSPFDGDTAMAIMIKHINAPLTPPYMINPRIPADVNEIICRMMAKDPGDRYQDYEPLIRDMEAAKIHRMSKEHGYHGTDGGAPHDTATVLLNASHAESHTGGLPPPKSYMTEGLVHLDFSDMPDEPPPSRARFYALLLAVLIFIIGAVATALHPRETPTGRERSPLAQWIFRMTHPEEGQTKYDTSPEMLAKADAEKVSSTRGAMEATLTKILAWRNNPQNRDVVPKISELRRQGVLTESETRDGWGHDLVITSARGGVLISAGRDGEENTKDDFVYSINGSPIQVPAALTMDDFAVAKPNGARRK